MIKYLLATAFLISSFVTTAQNRGDYLSFQKLESLSKETIDSMVYAATGYPGSFLGIKYGVDIYYVRYYTRDFHPDSITIATGLVGIPSDYACNNFSIATFGHGLCIKDGEVPSTNNGSYALITKGIASNGFIVISPDYIHLGVGASPGFQGFQHTETEASATIDLVRAVRIFCAGNNIGLNGQIFLTGYSQGGHSSMATAKVMQEEHPLEFNVTALCSGGGTYDLSGIAADSLASPTRTTPERHALPLVVRSYVEVYKDSLPQYGFPSDPVAAFDSIFESPYDQWLEVGLKRDTTFFPDQLDSIPSRMISDSLEYQLRNDPNFFFRKILAYNDLYHWVPQMSVRLFQSESDIEDPIANTYFTLQQFQQNGAPDVQLQTVTGMTHPEAAIPWILATRSFIKGLRIDCNTSIDDTKQQDAISIYPNPASASIIIETPEATALNGMIQIYDASGTAVISKRVQLLSRAELNVSSLANGNYLVGVEQENGLKRYRLITVFNEP